TSGTRRRGAPRETTPMALQLSVQVAAWLHAEVVAGAPFERIQPVLARQGFDEVQVRRIYNAVLTDPDGFRAGFERVAAGQPPVGHGRPRRPPDAPAAAPGAGTAQRRPRSTPWPPSPRTWATPSPATTARCAWPSAWSARTWCSSTT